MEMLFHLVAKTVFGVSLKRYKIYDFIYTDISKTCEVFELRTANNRASVVVGIQD